MKTSGYSPEANHILPIQNQPTHPSQTTTHPNSSMNHPVSHPNSSMNHPVTHPTFANSLSRRINRKSSISSISSSKSDSNSSGITHYGSCILLYYSYSTVWLIRCIKEAWKWGKMQFSRSCGILRRRRILNIDFLEQVMIQDSLSRIQIRQINPSIRQTDSTDSIILIGFLFDIHLAAAHFKIRSLPVCRSHNFRSNGKIKMENFRFVDQFQIITWITQIILKHRPEVIIKMNIYNRKWWTKIPMELTVQSIPKNRKSLITNRTTTRSINLTMESSWLINLN